MVPVSGPVTNIILFSGEKGSTLGSVSDTRYLVDSLMVQGISGPEPITTGGAVVVAPFSRAATGVARSDAEVRRSLPKDEEGVAALMADSVEDVCRIHDVRISGEFLDVDGSAKSVDVPVRNERDFTVSELTRRAAGLRMRYIEMRQCEALVAALDRQERGPLTAEEIHTLELLAETLEASVPAEEDAR